MLREAVVRGLCASREMKTDGPSGKIQITDGEISVRLSGTQETRQTNDCP